VTGRASPKHETLPPSVLIADDEPSIRLLVATTIEANHYTVLEATDGDEAWAMIEQYRPNLVLLDAQMPGRGGLEVLQLIRRDPSLDSTWVIMLTSRALESDRSVGLAAGADLYVTKPFSPLELLNHVERTLSRQRPTDHFERTRLVLGRGSPTAV